MPFDTLNSHSQLFAFDSAHKSETTTPTFKAISQRSHSSEISLQTFDVIISEVANFASFDIRDGSKSFFSIA